MFLRVLEHRHATLINQVVADIFFVVEIEKFFRFFKRPQKCRDQQLLRYRMEGGKGAFGDGNAFIAALVAHPSGGKTNQTGRGKFKHKTLCFRVFVFSCFCQNRPFLKPLDIASSVFKRGAKIALRSDFSGNNRTKIKSLFFDDSLMVIRWKVRTFAGNMKFRFLGCQTPHNFRNFVPKQIKNALHCFFKMFLDRVLKQFLINNNIQKGVGKNHFLHVGGK